MSQRGGGTPEWMGPVFGIAGLLIVASTAPTWMPAAQARIEQVGSQVAGDAGDALSDAGDALSDAGDAIGDWLRDHAPDIPEPPDPLGLGR